MPHTDNRMQVDLVIGIDSGVNTGIAVWSARQKRFLSVQTVMIHQAFKIVLTTHELNIVTPIKVRVEDARQVRFKTNAKRTKGAGSVCRDAKAWEDFLTDHNIPFEMVRPNPAITKWTAEKFATATGWTGKTNSHGRDAGMLCFGF